jgi:hypothetical protein
MNDEQLLASRLILLNEIGVEVGVSVQGMR